MLGCLKGPLKADFCDIFYKGKVPQKIEYVGKDLEVYRFQHKSDVLYAIQLAERCILKERDKDRFFRSNLKSEESSNIVMNLQVKSIRSQLERKISFRPRHLKNTKGLLRGQNLYLQVFWHARNSKRRLENDMRFWLHLSIDLFCFVSRSVVNNSLAVPHYSASVNGISMPFHPVLALNKLITNMRIKIPKVSKLGLDNFMAVQKFDIFHSK